MSFFYLIRQIIDINSSPWKSYYNLEENLISAYKWPWGFKSSWTPAEITTDLWLDAADRDTITLDVNGKVEQWDDKSGNIRSYSQATGSYRPTYVVNGFNGQPTFVFTENHYLDPPGSGPTASVGSFSLFVVANPNLTMTSYSESTSYTTAVTGTNRILFEPYHGSSTGFSGYGLALATNRVCSMEHASSYAPVVASVANSEPLKAMYEGYTLNQRHYIRKDGVLIRTGLVGSKSVKLETNTKIGSTFGWGSFGGQVCEIIAVPGEISTDDRQKIEGYLAHKWGLVNNLDYSHPYKNIPPY